MWSSRWLWGINLFFWMIVGELAHSWDMVIEQVEYGSNPKSTFVPPGVHIGVAIAQWTWRKCPCNQFKEGHRQQRKKWQCYSCSVDVWRKSSIHCQGACRTLSPYKHYEEHHSQEMRNWSINSIIQHQSHCARLRNKSSAWLLALHYPFGLRTLVWTALWTQDTCGPCGIKISTAWNTKMYGTRRRAMLGTKWQGQ